MKKINIVVTGGNGFIGSNVINYLSKNKKLKIHSFYRDKLKKKIKNVNYTKLNLLKSFKFRKNISILIHCASLTPPKTDPKICLKKNTAMDTKILKALDLSNIKKIIFLSSISVYKKRNMSVISEDFHLDKSNPYGLSKILMEEELYKLSLNKKLKNIFILRLSGVLGIGSHSNFISELYNKFKSKKFKSFYVFNSNNYYNSIIHINDLNKIIHNLIFKNSLNQLKIINIFSLNPIKWKTIFKIFKKKINNNVELFNKTSKSVSYLMSSKNRYFLDIKLPTVKKTLIKYLDEKNHKSR